MSWSENRGKESSYNWEEKRSKLEQVNGVLHKISQDEDFYDDLKIPLVQTALDHWTGKKRLPPDEAVKLQDHRRAVYVLQRIQMLSSVCQAAGIAVPLDLLLQKELLDIDSFKPKSEPSSKKEETKPIGVAKPSAVKQKALDRPEPAKSTEKAATPSSPTTTNTTTDTEKVDKPEEQNTKESDRDRESSAELKKGSDGGGLFGRPNNTLLVGLIFLLLYFILSRLNHHDD